MNLNLKSTDHNFLGIPSEFSGYENSEFVILPVPYEQTTTYREGTKHAPQAIINASHEVETFDEELKFEVFKAGICTLHPMEASSAGPQPVLDRICDIMQELIGAGKKVGMIGGEHTISIGAVRAFKGKCPHLTVLQLDAHADLRDSYQDNKFSHACVMRRIAEISHFVGVGIRNLSQDEFGFIQKNRIDIIWAQEIRNHNRSEGYKTGWKEEVWEKLGPDVYLTFDLDALDPSIMPAVGTPEPGGLLWYETLDFLKELIQRKNVVGFDVVELCPIPGMIAPDFLAAKLIYKIIGYLVNKENRV